MRASLLLGTLLVGLSGSASGNTGVFFGSGHSVQLVKSADVRMVSEDVTIKPVCGASATKHSVEFRCKFILKNISAKSVRIQVGFPLDGEAGGPPRPFSDDCGEVLARHFIARDASNTYHVRHVANSLNKYPRVFLWDMEFAAGETKTLHVGYILPMSFAAYTARKVEAPERMLYPPHYEKAWHARIEACMVLYFSYVTETGQSWVGPIEKATFRVENAVFEGHLRKFPEYVGGNPADLPPGTEIPDEGSSSAGPGSMAELGFVNGMKLGTVYPRISPKAWKSAYTTPEIPAGQSKPEYEPNCIVWEYENYKPGPPLNFAYYLLALPETAAECEPWVKRVLGKTRTAADVLELREIVAAFFGIAPHTASVKRLVQQQIWYNAQSGMGESELSEKQRAVLARLETIANGRRSASPPH